MPWQMEFRGLSTFFCFVIHSVVNFILRLLPYVNALLTSVVSIIFVAKGDVGDAMAVLQMCFISQLFVWMAEEQHVLQWVCFIFTVIIGVLWCVENAIMLIDFGTWNIVAGVLGFTFMMIYVDDLFWYGDYKCLRFSEQVLILQVFILLTTIVLIIYPSLEFDADLHMLLDLRMCYEN